MVGAQDTVLRGGVGLQEEKHGGEAGRSPERVPESPEITPNMML